MARKRRLVYSVLHPDLQISFYYRLRTLRDLYLQDALKAAVSTLDIAALDQELARLVAPQSLQRVASFGLRGEIFFAVPCVLKLNSFLLGYYRLLLGLSQKEFYNKGPFGAFKRLEDRGDLPDTLESRLPPLCNSLIQSAQLLVDGIDDLSLAVAHDLQLLTVGPQLRGSANTRIGQEATKEVFSLIRRLVRAYTREVTERSIRLENDSGRTVLIEFFSDPDIRITEVLSSQVRPLVSVEVKGGTDASNIHNRIGEAEKSHQKAKNRGFFEFWTILRVDVEGDVARRESPTTTHFFHLDRIANRRTAEHRAFRDLLGSLAGISVSP